MALDHYLNGSGTNMRMPISEVNAPFPIPTNFPSIRNLINQGTGNQPSVSHTINGAQSAPVATSGQQAAFLGRITFTASGTLNVYMTGDYQFLGSVGVATDTYNFDRDRATGGGRRTSLGQSSTNIGARLPGRPHNFVFDGQRRTYIEGNANGISQIDCR